MMDMWNLRADGRRPKTHARGLTLLEVLIALVIISTALVGLVTLENQDIRAITSAQRTTLASMLARNMMAQIELAGFPEDLGEEEGDFQEWDPDEDVKVPYAGFRWRRSIEPVRLGGQTFQNVRRIQVTIFWSEGKREKQLDVVTYLARRVEGP